MWIYTGNKAFVLSQFEQLYIDNPLWLQTDPLGVEGGSSLDKWALFGMTANGHNTGLLIKSYSSKKIAQSAFNQLMTAIENREDVCYIPEEGEPVRPYAKLFKESYTGDAQ